MTHGLPELSHRHIGPLVILHGATREDVSCGGLVLYGHAVAVCILRHSTVEIVHKQAVLCPTEIIEELRRLLQVIYHIAKQSRYPHLQFISCLLEESLGHAPRPCLGIAFPTVHQHVVQQSLERSSLQTSHITVILIVHQLRVKLVDLPACGLGRSRSVAPSCIDVPNAEYGPFPFGDSPSERVCPYHHACQVHYFCGANVCLVRLLWCLVITHNAAQGPATFTLPVALTCCGIETHAADIHGMLIDYLEAIPACRNLIESKGHGVGILPVGHREVTVQHHLLRSILGESRHTDMYAGVHPKGVVESVDGIEHQRA